jgi:hypothetical protein
MGVLPSVKMWALMEVCFALKHKLVRVLMATPFTSIIEQNTDVYRAAPGPLAEAGLVEHHTHLQPARDTRSNQLGTENWDAPLIVTTNVQLMESLAKVVAIRHTARDLSRYPSCQVLQMKKQTGIAIMSPYL